MICGDAAVAQLVERKLPKLEVAGSTPVRRLQEQSWIWLWELDLDLA